MERPVIKDEKVLEYVNYLEQQLEHFNSDNTTVQSYLGLKNIVDQINDICRKARLDIPEVDEDGKSEEQIKEAKRQYREQQKTLEKALDFSDRIDKYNEQLEKLFKKAKPDLLKKAQEVESGGLLEDAIRSGTKKV